ncbi:MAG: CBS domain-containing protein [Patescibacteria group bacterium]
MFARDLMTKQVTTVGPSDSILTVAQIMFDHNWDGIPVVTKDGTLMGIITQYDLVTKGANIHLPTFLKLMSELPLYKKDKSGLKHELERIVTLSVKDLMNIEPLTVYEHTTLEEVSRLFAEHHRVNPIPVVSQEGRLVGIISRFDLIKLYTGTKMTAEAINQETSVDKKVDLFVEGFGKNFLVVSKFAPMFWKIVSVLFVIVGFIIAMALIIRIELRN